MKVAVVEKRATHGGTCLNVGCIPSKALLHASELYAEAANGFAAMGIKVKPSLDLAAMLAFKDPGVKGNVDGVAFLLKKNKIDTVHGQGRIAGTRQGRGHGRRRQEADAGGQIHPHRHGLRGGGHPRHRHRREENRLLHRRAVAAASAAAPGGDRRGLYRARARLGVAPARRASDRGRDARPRRPRPRRRGGQAIPAHPREAGHRLQARHEGARASRPRARRAKSRSSPQAAARRKRWTATWCSSASAACPTRKGWGSPSSA